jgi:RNA-directed DNA polymerase
LYQAKSHSISKQLFVEAYRQVKANRGAAGVDGQTIEDFASGLDDNLYKIWNRMSSGSYFPPPVKGVEIPKLDGKVRLLGIPTVSDRVAQMVCKLELEPLLEPHFHEDSYGYRPARSAIDAIGLARRRCWESDWVLDIDIKGFFDNLDHELLLKALKRHTENRWILIYVERWLRAPIQLPDGSIVNRDQGTPQGGVISPLLANLFLHYAFDEWMKINNPSVCFERYCDDIIVHCKSKKQAESLKVEITRRMASCNLELHPEKTKIVYCKDDKRNGRHDKESFDFLGYTFQPREAKNSFGQRFIGFLPAVSIKARKSILDKLRKLHVHRRSDMSIEELSQELNPILRGWINYFGKFYKSALRFTCVTINRMLVKWAMRKYKKLRCRLRKAIKWFAGIAQRQPQLFASWCVVQF